MVHTSRRKIFYPVGFISLALLLPFGLGILKHWNIFEVNRVLQVVWYDPHHSSPIFDPVSLPPPTHAFTTINLTGDNNEDRLTLNKVKENLTQLVADSTVGIHLHFNDEVAWQHFVKALDISQSAGLLFLPYENNAWIFRPWRAVEKKGTPHACGGVRSSCIQSATLPVEKPIKYPLSFLIIGAVLTITALTRLIRLVG